MIWDDSCLFPVDLRKNPRSMFSFFFRFALANSLIKGVAGSVSSISGGARHQSDLWALLNVAIDRVNPP